MKCCGVHKPEEWRDVYKTYLHPACCQKEMGDKTCNIPTYDQGCEDKLKEFVSHNVMIVAGVAIGVGVFQVCTPLRLKSIGLFVFHL